ncbi:mitochondrial ribonuclease P protein 1 homolog isoform X1 [Panonychus citri]|uniref:mitochondrial ribonuclease P protein 1 homolog isoform X1 n=1 Tax=Panonychus citri TaxID=50023 RepID=UPI002306ECF3|nr:mitochondrial ribonuclease P protein 1 homolog isoform X1 [Panonychus citri]
MRFKLFSAQSPSSFNLVYKKNLFQYSGLQANPSRSSSSSLFSSSSSASCDLSRKTLSSILFSNSKFKSNLSSFRVYSKRIDYDKDEIYANVTYEDLTVDMFKELIKTEKDAKLVGEILSFYEYIKFDTGIVPSTIKVTKMYELMKLPRNSWQSSFKYLYEKEHITKGKRLHRSQRSKSSSYNDIQRIKDEGKTIDLGIQFDPKTGAPQYGEWLNSHFIRIRQFEYRCSFFSNLLSSCLFGTRLIIDCDYDYDVISAKNVIHDLQKAFAHNRTAIEPFNLTLTGLKNQIFLDLLNEYSVSYKSSYGHLGIEQHSENFDQLFPNQKLIYLSPYSKATLTHFDEDAIYIIGGLSSRSSEPLSLKKALSLKIPNYCFPTTNLSFRAMKNAKAFDISECTKIMLLSKETKDINLAVGAGISLNRLKTSEEIEEEQNRRMSKLLSTIKKLKKHKPIRE